MSKLHSNVNFVRLRDDGVVKEDVCRVNRNMSNGFGVSTRESSRSTEFRIFAQSYCFMGKSSIYEVHSFSSLVINQSPEINYRPEKSNLAVREYKHFQ